MPSANTPASNLHPDRIIPITSKTRTRVRKACLNCRRRKSKCIFADGVGSQGPCERCFREHVECQVPLTTRRGGFANVLAGKERQKREALFRLKALQDVSSAQSTARHSAYRPPEPARAQIPEIKPPYSGSIYTPAPLPPASALPSSAPPISALPSSAPPASAPPASAPPTSAPPASAPAASAPPVSAPPFGAPPSSCTTVPAADSTVPKIVVPLNTADTASAESALHRELYSVNDALSILCAVVNDHQQRTSAQNLTATSVQLPPIAQDGAAEQRKPPPTAPSAPAACAEPLAESDLVKKRLGTVAQIEALIQYFFVHIEPYVPFVHVQFSDRARLAQQPLLASTICTISAKYSRDPAMKRLYTPLAEYCQVLLANMSTVTERGEEGNDDQVAASILAVLLHCEWLVDSQLTLDQNNRVSWLLAGSGVRLAQWSGILNHNKTIYVVLHWLENVIGCRIGLDPSLKDVLPPPKIKQQLQPEDEARLDIVNLLQMGYRTLYSCREATRQSVNNGTYLTSLQLLHPQFERWVMDFENITHDQESWSSRSIVFEFHHCRLYVYSLALVQQSRFAGTAEASVFTESRRYLRYAIDSAIAIINFQTDPRNPVGIHLGPPMRWIVRFVHAAVFLSKAILTPPIMHPVETAESLAEMVSKAAQAMESSGPVNLQLMGRYTKVMREIESHVQQSLASKRGSPVSQTLQSGQTTSVSSPSPTQLPPRSQPSSTYAANTNDSRRPSQVTTSSYNSPSATTTAYSYRDLLEDSGLLGVDNTMLYMPWQYDGGGELVML